MPAKILKQIAIVLACFIVFVCCRCQVNAFTIWRGAPCVLQPLGRQTHVSVERRIRSSKVGSLNLLEIANEQDSASLNEPIGSLEAARIPTDLSEAARVFFLSGDKGPTYIVSLLFVFFSWRIELQSFHLLDVLAFSGAVIFWWFQEHFIHQRLLHSSFDWIGKEIHQVHHAKPYYHVSRDPAGLLIGWMLSAHVLLRLMLPLPFALSATIGYSLAGLFYEWAHYIVHTKVRCKSSFWKRVKENHIRHHVVDHDYWFGFSLPWVDDLFHTNPSLAKVRQDKDKA